MEAVKQWPGLGTMAEEVEEDVSLQRKIFRQNSNTMKTNEDGTPVQPLHPAQSFDDSEDTGSSSESPQSASPNFLISDGVLDKTLRIEIESSDIRNGAVKHFNEKIQPLSFIDEHVPMDSFSSGSGKQLSFTNEIIETGKAKIREEIQKEVGELDLERELEIRKRELDLREEELENRLAAERRSVLADTFRCSACFSFLIPIGNWFLPKRAEKDPAEQGNWYRSSGWGPAFPTSAEEYLKSTIVERNQKLDENPKGGCLIM